MRHFRRQTAGKLPIKHGSALVANTGQGTATIFGHVIFETDVGQRTPAGGTRGIKDIADTGRTCNVGDIVKYANVCIECSPRGATPTNPADNSGWLEWAIVWQEEDDVLPTTANLGVSPLATVCTNFYRQNCLLTGCFPLGTLQAMSADIRIKLPKKCTRLRMGCSLQCLCHVRTSSSTDVRTDSHRLMVSSLFKAYS